MLLCTGTYKISTFVLLQGEMNVVVSHRAEITEFHSALGYFVTA